MKDNKYYDLENIRSLMNKCFIIVYDPKSFKDKQFIDFIKIIYPEAIIIKAKKRGT